MSNSNDSKYENVYSVKVQAGSRRTYFFDVRKTRGEDYYVTLTESTKKHNSDSYERHKIFLYKEDFNRFLSSLQEVIDHVKVDLMPDYDYEEFDRKQAEWELNNQHHEDGDHHASPEKSDTKEEGSDVDDAGNMSW